MIYFSSIHSICSRAYLEIKCYNILDIKAITDVGNESLMRRKSIFHSTWKLYKKWSLWCFFRVSVHPYSPATPSEGHFPIYLLTLMCSGLWKVLEKYHEKINIHEWTTKIPWVALLGPDSKDNEELICKHAWFDKNPCRGRECSNDIQCVKGKWENKGLKSLSISLN